MRTPRFHAALMPQDSEPHPLLVRDVAHLDDLSQHPGPLPRGDEGRERSVRALLRHHRAEAHAQVEGPPHLVLVDGPALRDHPEDGWPLVRAQAKPRAQPVGSTRGRFPPEPAARDVRASLGGEGGPRGCPVHSASSRARTAAA